MSIAVKIENVGKKYIISHKQKAHYNTLRGSISNFTKNIIKNFKNYSKSKDIKEEFWALRNISLQIQKGQKVGIIGANGAGKSTLLKLLSRITEPSEGRITLKGRVASLLEVGTGFHPELTGRENIYLNGAILGMTRNEIKEKFHKIVNFAQVDKFLDTPVKRYSSGMFVRLAFSVAAHLEPEILIVDEVLAVGDIDFQKKCLGKMEEVGKEGRTVIFVSHNMGAISSLCSKCIVLDKGLLKFQGDTVKGISYYLGARINSFYENSNPIKDKPLIRKAWIENQKGEIVSHLYNGEPFNIVIETENPQKESLEISLSFYDYLRRPLWAFTHSMYGFKPIPSINKVTSYILITPPRLSASDITINIAIAVKGEHNFSDLVVSGLKYSIIHKTKGVKLSMPKEYPIICPAQLKTKI